MFLNKNKLKAKVDKLNDKYWNTWEVRWDYMSKVIEEIEEINPTKILELGAYKINLTSISDNMDIEEDFIDPDSIDNIKYIQDAADLPWKIKDKFYDVFVALQVFEHLEGNQLNVFKEISRISKNAILSFPYKWNSPPDNCHYMIDDEKIAKWTNNIKPEKVIHIDKRVIYVFKFN